MLLHKHTQLAEAICGVVSDVFYGGVANTCSSSLRNERGLPWSVDPEKLRASMAYIDCYDICHGKESCESSSNLVEELCILALTLLPTG